LAAVPSPEDAFTLDPRLAADTLPLGRFPLSLLLLMNDATYPWCVLVPARAGIMEIHMLGVQDRNQLLAESCHLAERMAEGFSAHKMNVAALGNVVLQLHLHHVARFRDDPAWPGPVWGRAPRVPYDERGLAAFRERLLPTLKEGFRAEGPGPTPPTSRP
jgi:diadenosine tetraphosphate (Ap4A) HIT family hydrolase